MKKQFFLLAAMAIAFSFASIDHHQLDTETACFLMGDNVAFADIGNDGTIDPGASGHCAPRYWRLCWTHDGSISFLKEWVE